jgi:hypothetical protein
MVMDAKARTRQLIGILLSFVPVWIFPLISMRATSQRFARVRYPNDIDER